jgi:cell fate (sporulation/competence/biofilm development) regulator YlbF (YheA/YmcA/DUF963 family)
MATDTTEIMSLAEKIGQLLKDHPSVIKYKAAQEALAKDPDAARIMGDFNRMLEALGRQEQQGMSISDAQRQSLEAMQSKIVSHIKIKALNLAEVEFYDLLRKISQTYQRPLMEGMPGAAARQAAQGQQPMH